MASMKVSSLCFLLVLICVAALTSSAQSFRVQCPTSTVTHPGNLTNVNAEPPYNGPTVFGTQPVVGTSGGYVVPTSNINGAIKCQQISGGDGYATMADGTQTFMFAFGPLSGLADIAAGLPGTEFPNVFNTVYPGTCSTCNGFLQRGDPATTDGATTGASPGTVGTFTYNGAIGLAPDIANIVTITDIVEGTPPLAPDLNHPPANLPAGADYCSTIPGTPGYPGPNVVTAYTDAPLGLPVGASVLITNNAGSLSALGTPMPPGYQGTWTITCVNNNVINPGGFTAFAITYTDPIPGLAADTGNNNAGTAATVGTLDGHVDPRPIIDIGVMNGSIPAPLLAFDEDDEVFFTLTNVGMIMRPDLFEQHTVHFHGYPNASTFYDGVPDASVAINIGGSFTYYYLSPDAGTYFWHCHITPPEHLQMGMVGQLYVRPRQDRVPSTTTLYAALQQQNGGADLRTACNPAADILCSAVTPPAPNSLTRGTDLLGNPQKYVYNDGDGSTAYDVEYPIQMHGFDPNFHFVGMTFNPEAFMEMKDKYFLLNGRSYPDTVGPCGGVIAGCAPGPQATVSSDGMMHYAQPLPALINIPVGGKALLRLVNLSVTEYHTLASLGIPMHVVGWNAKLLRDQAGNNTEYYTNSITLGGGESLDAILDVSDATCGATGCSTTLYPAGSVFYLFTPQLDHLSNDAENFGGLMTEVHICHKVIGGTFGNTCM
jgi:hypothetical protein